MIALRVKKLSLTITVFLWILLLFTSLNSPQIAAQELPPPLPPPSGNSMTANFWIFLNERYDFLDSDVQNKVIVDIAFNFIVPPPVKHMLLSGIPFSLSNVSGLPENTNSTYGFWGFPPIGVLTIVLPEKTQNASIRLEGSVSGKSVFWRNLVELRIWNVSSALFGLALYKLILVPPPSSRVLRVYSRFYPDISYQRASIDGWDSFVVPYIVGPTVVLYESEAWQTNAFIVMLIIILSIYALLFVSKWRKILDTLSVLRTRISTSSVRLLRILRIVYKEIGKLDSSKLLTIYILFALLMVSVSFLAGPDPRLKVYVLSSTETNAASISNSVESTLSSVTITIFDKASEFGLLADLGVFQTVIVGDFFPPTKSLMDTQIDPGLDVIPSIIVIMEYVDSAFLSELQTRYSQKITLVEDLPSLQTALLDVPRRTNALGLPRSVSIFIGVSGFVGIASLLLPFWGLAFLASKLIEVGRKTLVSGFVEAVVYSVLIFFFTQAIYIACSVLLGLPLGLHASSSPKVTALGFMGFGGGSRPRMFIGLAGFLFGALISMKGGLKLDKIGFLTFLVMAFFVIVDPLTSGIVFYEFILLFTVGPGFDTAATTMSYIKDFLSSGGVLLGGWISPVYQLSTGIIFFFATAIPFCLFPKLRKSTATFLLLFSAFGAADGGIRVANMEPWMTIASILPGVVIGLLFCALFYSINAIETGFRTKIKT